MNNLPTHVAIIMDGNGRWAEEKGLKRSMGHKAGGEALEKIAMHAKVRGIKYLSIYAFSTDNFKRPKEEVNYLMDLIIYYFNEKLLDVVKNDIKVIVSGRRDNLRLDVINAIKNIEDVTKNNKDCILNICLNYGSQEEIVDGVLKVYEDLLNGNITKDKITKEYFYNYLYQNIPPIDLLIRTGKEKRLSNFMLYQASYAELYFLDEYFPNFSCELFDNILADYQKRERRFGKIKIEKTN